MLTNQKVFTETDLPQGSSEWLKWRESHLGASEVSSVLGTSIFNSPMGVWLLKTGRQESAFMNADMERGKKLEPMIRQTIEKEYGVNLTQVCLEHNDDDFSFLSASLDGLDLTNRHFWEIKAPRVESYVKIVESKTIGQWYVSQMLQQQIVIESIYGSGWIGYFAVMVEPQLLLDYYQVQHYSECPIGNLQVIEFNFDEKQIQQHLEITKKFWSYVENDVEPADFTQWRRQYLKSQNKEHFFC